MLKKNQIIDVARLSYLCYLSEKEVCKFYINRPFNKNSNELVFNKVANKPKFINCLNTDCQLMTVDYANHLVVVFRGTESKKDILTDINIYQKKLKLNNNKYDPYVHSGFLNQFMSIEKKLEENLKNQKSIIFCGHSLGGALATIASLHYKFMFKDKYIGCVTFGSPRVGNNSFVDLFNENINFSLRYVNDNDPIPCFPTRWRYRHVNGLQWLNNDIIENEIKTWRFYRFMKNFILNFFGFGYNSLDDHSCKNYISDITNIL